MIKIFRRLFTRAAPPQPARKILWVEILKLRGLAAGDRWQAAREKCPRTQWAFMTFAVANERRADAYEQGPPVIP